METNFVKAGSNEIISVSSHSLDKTNEMFDTKVEESERSPVFSPPRKENISRKAYVDEEEKKLDAELLAFFNRNEIQIYFKILN